MMKNILDIDIYLHNHIDKTSYVKKIAALSKAFVSLHTFQKVQINPLVFSEGTR